MRTRRKVLLALPAPLIVALALAAGGSSAAPPGATYGWGQPGCAPVVVPCAQPPVSVPIAPVAVVAPAPPVKKEAPFNMEIISGTSKTEVKFDKSGEGK